MKTVQVERYGQVLRQLVNGCEGHPHRAEEPEPHADWIEWAASNHERYVAGQDEEIRWETCEAARRALARIEQETFGSCAECGQAIDPKRLEALPWADYCLRCQVWYETEAVLQKAA